MKRPDQWGRASRTPAQRGRGARGSMSNLNAADIYDDLLDEALRQSAQVPNRPLKKRKSQRDPNEMITIDDKSSGQENIAIREREVVVIESTAEESVDEDEMEWDEVDLTAAPISEEALQPEEAAPVREVTLQATPPKATKKRAAATARTAISRQIRLEAHRMHLLALLASLRNLNSLLSSPTLLKIVRAYVPPATVNALNTGPEHTQARRTIAFLSGLKDLVKLWHDKWKETKRGWRRPRWVDMADLGKIPAYIDLTGSISLESLIDAAKTKSGTRDMGAWLFASLLRSAGVEARLICSLQPLQFGFLNEGPRQEFYEDAKAPPTTAPPTTEIPREQSHISISSTDDSAAPTIHRARNPQFPSSVFRETGMYITPAEYIARTKTFSPHHPYFWCEAWDVASQRWIAVEPMIGARVNQPSKIEPPVTAAAWEAGTVGDNLLTYVIGFDSCSYPLSVADVAGFAKDVTRRYAKAYYSKTFRYRIESQGGEKWWKRIMGYLDRTEPLDRDQLEEVELSSHLLKEPIPKKIDDFRHHPLYVLGRHLKKNEMVAPDAVHVSAMTSGKGMNLKTEKVYKRKDVIACLSARDWFRRGRIVKEGEQPIKHSGPSRRRGTPEDGDDEEDSSKPLYSQLQTELYIPPPVIDGIVPKNNYGNIDIYVPSMVPSGGVHIIRPSIALAADFAGIDYAEAVTGFDFARNKASARVNGIVVAKENVDGLLEVWEGMMERVKEEEERLRRKGVLERWQRFFIKLGIKQRLDDRHGKVDEDVEMVVENEDLDGGFLPNNIAERPVIPPEPTESKGPSSWLKLGSMSSEKRASDENIANLSFPAEVEANSKAMNSSTANTTSLALEKEKAPDVSELPEDEEGGGFILEDQGSEGGVGFVATEDEGADDDFEYEEDDGIL